MQDESSLVSPDELARLREAPDGLLVAAVRIGSGTSSTCPSPLQVALHADVLTVMSNAGQIAAVKPDGAWFPALAAAMTAAVERGERTLLSTHSLSQMGQLRDEIVPALLAAVRLLSPGAGVEVAFVQGPGGYVDPAKVIATAQLLTGSSSVSFGELAGLLEQAPGRLPGARKLQGVEDIKVLRDLVQWALRTYLDDRAPGDRISCPISHTPAYWSYVSAGAGATDSGEQFGVESKAHVAMNAAADAHIVITTHPTLFSLHAAGGFDHVVIDEAHALPAIVQQQGTAWLMGGNIISSARQAARATGSASRDVETWCDAAQTIAAEIDEALRGHLRYGYRQSHLPEHFTDLDRMVPIVEQWVRTGVERLAPVGESGDVRARVEATAAAARLTALLDSIRAVTAHKPGWKRWVELQPVRPDAAPTDRPWVIGVSAPHAVGFLLTDAVWFQPSENDPHEMVPRTVICLAPALPERFPADVGLQCPIRDYAPLPARRDDTAVETDTLSSAKEFARAG